MSEPSRSVVEQALALAARAPSAHNAQPWTVRVEGAQVAVLVDPSRWLRHSDPSRRDLHLSLGAFVEALGLAFAASGVRAEPRPPTNENAQGDFAARFVLRDAGAPPNAADREAASLLRRRATSRLAYAPRPLPGAALEELRLAARGAGLDLHLVEDRAPERQDLNTWHYVATREAWLDPRAVAELGSWLRLDPEGVRQPEDGLSTHCLGLSPLQTAAMTALIRPGLWRLARGAYVAPVIAAALARSETRAFELSPVVGVLIAPDAIGAMAGGSDGVVARTTSGAGGSLLRVWLAATRLRLAMAPTSLMLDRRGWELARRLGVSPSRLVGVFRIGHSAPPPRSARRPVPRFASFASFAAAAPEPPDATRG